MREEQEEGAGSPWATLQGSVDIHRGRQDHFLPVSHRSISKRKKAPGEPGSWTFCSPKCHLPQDYRGAGIHSPYACTRACRHTLTHTILLSCVQILALIHIFTHSHSYTIACVPTSHTHPYLGSDSWEIESEMATCRQETYWEELLGAAPAKGEDEAGGVDL